MRRTGPTEPHRLAGPTRPEPAHEPLHAAGARCCAPGTTWRASDPQLVGEGWPAPHGQLAGDGTADRSAASGRARGHGWRLVGRGLVTGGFLLCGWLATSAGHAYASQITAPAAPHVLLTGIPANALLAGSDAAQAGPSPVAQRPASTLLALPSFPGSAGVGAGNQASAAQRAVSPVQVATSAVQAAAKPATSAVQAAAKPATGALSAAPGQVVSLASGLEASATGGQVTSVAKILDEPASAVLQVPATAVTGAQAAVFAGRPGASPASVRSLTPVSAVARRPAARAARLTSLGRRLAGYPTVAAESLVGNDPSKGAGARHSGAAVRHPSEPRRRLPAERVDSAATTQTDPTSSSGGPGAAQLAAQAPPTVGTRNPAGRLVRIRASRWPVGRLGANDPAVTPD